VLFVGFGLVGLTHPLPQTAGCELSLFVGTAGLISGPSDSSPHSEPDLFGLFPQNKKQSFLIIHFPFTLDLVD
jgi:hypothetical protein